MKLMKHPLHATEKRLQDTYMIIDGDYKGSTFDLTNLKLDDTDNEVNFDLSLIVLLYKEKEVRDVFLIGYHFAIIQEHVSKIVVDALTTFVDSYKEEKRDNA